MALHTSTKKIAVIATDYFEEQELISPMHALRNAGVGVEVIAPHSGKIKSLNHVDPGQPITVDVPLENADPNIYAGLIIPGGVVNADHLRMDEKARDFLRKIMAADRPVAIICHGPWLLISAGLARGKRLTSYYTLQDDIRNAGGEWADEEVVVDKNLITSRKPDDLPAFNSALLEMLR